MATLNRAVAIPLADYATGTYNLPETNIQVQATIFYFEVQRCTTLDPTIWPNAETTLAIRLELSNDNGATWRELASFTAVGGIHVKRDGTEAAVSTLQVSIGTGNQRRIRGTAQVINGPLRTHGFLETRNGA